MAVGMEVRASEADWAAEVLGTFAADQLIPFMLAAGEGCGSFNEGTVCKVLHPMDGRGQMPVAFVESDGAGNVGCGSIDLGFDTVAFNFKASLKSGSR